MTTSNPNASSTNHQSPPSPSSSKPTQPITKTLRNPTWTYFHLTYLPPTTSNENGNANRPLDLITTHLALRAATTQFGGLHASAIPVDILHLDPPTAEVFVRVPHDDARLFQAAVTSYGCAEGGCWWVNGRSEWDVTGGRRRRQGEELFG